MNNIEYLQEENQIEMFCDVCEVSFEKENGFHKHMLIHEGNNRKYNYDMNEKKAKKKVVERSK